MRTEPASPRSRCPAPSRARRARPASATARRSVAPPERSRRPPVGAATGLARLADAELARSVTNRRWPRYIGHRSGTLAFVKRLLALLAVPVLFLAVAPSASAQEEEPALTPVVDGLEEGLAQLDPVLEGLAPVLEPL